MGWVLMAVGAVMGGIGWDSDDGRLLRWGFVVVVIGLVAALATNNTAPRTGRSSR